MMYIFALPDKMIKKYSNKFQVNFNDYFLNTVQVDFREINFTKNSKYVIKKLTARKFS